MRGFSLIEIIVSLFIVLMLIMASQAMLFGTPLVRLARDQDIALTIAQNELEGLRGGGYDALPASGSFPDPLLSSLSSGSGNVSISDFTAQTKEVVVTVSWDEGDRPQSQSLSTLITQTGGLP